RYRNRSTLSLVVNLSLTLLGWLPGLLRFQQLPDAVAVLLDVVATVLQGVVGVRVHQGQGLVPVVLGYGEPAGRFGLLGGVAEILELAAALLLRLLPIQLLLLLFGLLPGDLGLLVLVQAVEHGAGNATEHGQEDGDKQGGLGRPAPRPLERPLPARHR